MISGSYAVSACASPVIATEAKRPSNNAFMSYCI